MLFRTLPVAPSCNKVSENEKTSGKRYRIVRDPRRYGWGTEAFVADPDGYTWALISLSKE
jgi:hypothetical protein